MRKHLFAVYGASGFGREVMPLALEQLRELGGGEEQLVFVDDKPLFSNINNFQVISFREFCRQARIGSCIALAVADSKVREKLALSCREYGFEPWSIKANNVVVLDEVDIEEGAIICHFVTITSNIQIGTCFHANIYSYVAHDCIIGNYVTFAPGVKCNGNVHIGDHAYIGTGAMLKQGSPGKPLIIGKGAVVGMGSVVTKEVPPGAVVVGNPARIMNK
ncbi:acetyltransferase [bacterium]|nr:acetyltransferase [bacterium]